MPFAYLGIVLFGAVMLVVGAAVAPEDAERVIVPLDTEADAAQRQLATARGERDRLQEEFAALLERHNEILGELAAARRRAAQADASATESRDRLRAVSATAVQVSLRRDALASRLARAEAERERARLELREAGQAGQQRSMRLAAAVSGAMADADRQPAADAGQAAAEPERLSTNSKVKRITVGERPATAYSVASRPRRAQPAGDRRGDDPRATARLKRGVEAYHAGDYERAFRLWLPLAEAGDPWAEFYVGALYLEGRGVDADAVRAYYWLAKARSADHGKAQKLLAPLEQRMTHQQVAAARSLLDTRGD